MNNQTMITSNEIEKLIASWKSDPCWDIEETEGFEAYYDELLAYRLEVEKQWEREWADKLEARAAQLKCSVELADYIIKLEHRLQGMNQTLENVYFRD